MVSKDLKIDRVRTDVHAYSFCSKNDQRLEQPTKILSNWNNREWIQNITAKSKLKLKQKLATNLDNTPPGINPFKEYFGGTTTKYQVPRVAATPTF